MERTGWSYVTVTMHRAETYILCAIENNYTSSNFLQSNFHPALFEL